MKKFLKKNWIWLGTLVAVAIVAIMIAHGHGEKPDCGKKMAATVTELRYYLENNRTESLRYNLEKFRELEECGLAFQMAGFSLSYTREEIRSWAKASAVKTLEIIKEAATLNVTRDLTPEFNTLAQAQVKYLLAWKDLGVSQYQLEQITKTWAKNQLRVKLDVLTGLVPENWLPGDLEDFDKTLAGVDKFRQEQELKWEEAHMSELVLECLRGTYYAERSRKLYESLRFYNLPQRDWQHKSPRHFAEAIYSASEKKGFCGYTAPTPDQVEQATKLAYARMAEQIILDLRAKEYAFPRSLRAVEELRQIFKEGTIRPEELGTSEREMVVLSRENPLRKTEE